MQITRTMDLGQLAEYMGTDATPEDAAKMRDALIARGIDDIEGIDESLWFQIMYEALT